MFVVRILKKEDEFKISFDSGNLVSFVCFPFSIILLLLLSLICFFFSLWADFCSQCSLFVLFTGRMIEHFSYHSLFSNGFVSRFMFVESNH